MNTARYRLGVDVGGTHTDLVLLDTTTGELAVEKVASTPINPALGVLEGIARFIAKGVPPSQVGFFAHLMLGMFGQPFRPGGRRFPAHLVEQAERRRR